MVCIVEHIKILIKYLNFLGNLCFVPLHCLPERKCKNISDILKTGLDAIITRAGRKTLFGKLTISVKKQDELGMLKCKSL